MGMKITGFDEFEKKLGKIQSDVNELSGERQVSFDELFNSDFMSKHTKFQSFEELLKGGGFVVNSPEDFAAIPDDQFDKHVSETTDFDKWVDMQARAAEEYYVKKMGF
ncbi:MAG TPA: hypothetical protein VFC84_00285 [Desulfosporosinus sp.]|nr:hypothetical protein [Desulfosporosinus sp.]